MPCYARKQVNKATGSILPVETEEEIYIFDLNKKTYKTRIYGDQYNKFLEDYNMKPYDKIKLEFGTNYIMMTPRANDGSRKERVKGNLFLLFIAFQKMFFVLIFLIFWH